MWQEEGFCGAGRKLQQITQTNDKRYSRTDRLKTLLGWSGHIGCATRLSCVVRQPFTQFPDTGHLIIDSHGFGADLASAGKIAGCLKYQSIAEHVCGGLMLAGVRLLCKFTRPTGIA